jgi:DNA topoisomerase III
MKKKPTKTMVKSLLKNGVALVKGLTSKKGNKFDAYLRYEKILITNILVGRWSFLKRKRQKTKFNK